MIICGIDSGKKGGFCFMNEKSEIIATHIMPVYGEVVSPRSISKLLIKYNTGYVFLERVWARPGNGISSMFKFGRQYGKIEACVELSGIRIETPTSAAWAKWAHKGLRLEAKDAKARSIIAVQRKYPKQKLLASSRCRVPHDGIVDAILIAGYGVHMLKKAGII